MVIFERGRRQPKNVRFGSKADICSAQTSCPLCANSGHWLEVYKRLGSGTLIVVTGINVTAVVALEEVHIISLFAPFNSLPKLQFAATTWTRAKDCCPSSQ